ncbi:MAG: hypothetical protein ACRD4F_08195, partial [Candidatus Angelobacter sp.]
WILAVLSTITIIHRIAYTYQQTRILDEKAAAEAAAKPQQTGAPAQESGNLQPGKKPQQVPSFN